MFESWFTFQLRPGGSPEDDCPGDDCSEDDCPEDGCGSQVAVALRDGSPEDDCPEDGCDPQEAAALKDYLLSTTITADATARRITIPVTDEPHTVRQGQRSDNLPRLWRLIINALYDLPEHRGKVIQLLQAIQSLPVSNPNEGANEIRWPDLPHFGRSWANEAIDTNWRRYTTRWTSKQLKVFRQLYILEAKIGAQLVVANISGFPVLYGLGRICDSLEKRFARLDFEVPFVKEWFEIAGDRIFAESDGEVAGLLRERDLWKHQVGGGRKQRWCFWKSRLHSMAASEHVPLKIRGFAIRAFEAMDAVDQ